MRKKLYKVLLVRPVMMYVLETVALSKKQKAELVVTMRQYANLLITKILARSYWLIQF